MEEVVRTLDEGRPLDRDELLAKYADVASDLAACLDNLDFIQSVAPQLANGASRTDVALLSPGHATLGDFRLVREIGRGGMGVVYEAEQISLRRRVALKVLPFAAMLDKQHLARFKNEARAAATLDHPNIVAIYSVGVERGVHYYAMHLVEGESLAKVVSRLRCAREVKKAAYPTPPSSRSGGAGERGDAADDTVDHRPSGSGPSSIDVEHSSSALDAQPVAPHSTLSNSNHRDYFRAIARLGVQASEALDHAHRSGILHRDVKPANLLVDNSGKLWVTDFGLARFEADAGMTMSGDLIGTLRYMSPEQALAKRGVVDHRSDVYSLGATLYELLTLEPPFHADDRQELLKQIAFQESKKPRQINPQMPRDLETIVLKAMEKSPADRFSTAQELANDLSRFLENQPIKAKPASLAHKFMKWSRRHVIAVWSVLAATLLATVAVAVGAASIARSRNEADIERSIANTERDEAVSQRNLARLNQYYAEIVSGQADLEHGNVARLHQKLIRNLPLDNERDCRGWEWYYLFTFCHPESRTLYYPHQRVFTSWSPDGNMVATAGVVWNAASGECLRVFTPSVTLNAEVDWSPDGQHLAWSNAADDSAVYVWSRQDDSIRALRGHADSVWCVAISPDGKQLASGSLDHSVKIWDVASGALVKTLSPGGDATDVSWSPDGKHLAVGLWGEGVRIYSATTSEIVAHWDEPDQPRVRLSWRPDSGRLAVNTPRHWYIVDCADWKVVKDHQHFGGAASRSGGGDIEWNASGSRIAFSEKQLVTVWDPEADRPVRTLTGHLSPVNSLSWSPDGRRLVTSDVFQEIRIWDLQGRRPPSSIAAGGKLQRLSWSSDSRTLVTVAAADLSTSFWNAVDGKQVSESLTATTAGTDSRELSPDRSLIAGKSLEGDGRSITVRDAATGEVRAAWRASGSFAPVEFAWSPDGSKLAITIESSTHHGLECWDVAKEHTISRWTSPKSHVDWDEHFALPTWSPDSARVAVRGWGDARDDGTPRSSSHAHIFDADSGGRILKRLFGNRPRFGGIITAIAWSSDSRRLALGSSEGLIDVVSLAAQVGPAPIKAHEAAISALRWSPDGRRLAVAGADGEVKLIETLHGNELLTLRGANGPVTHLAWSPNGRRLAAASDAGAVQLWDASPAYEFAAGGGRARELAWAYYQAANESAGSDVDELLRKTVELAPRELGFRMLRGAVLARLQEYDDAAKEFRAAAPKRIEHGVETAVLQLYALLGARDVEGFRRRLEELVHSLANADLPKHSRIVTIQFLAALVPDATTGFAEDVAYLREADDIADSQDRSRVVSTRALPCGAMEYRLGRYDDAIASLASLEKYLGDVPDPRGQFERACARYFLAMARRRLGHVAAAQRLLGEARATDEALQSDPNLNWNYRVALDSLHREARLMIEP